MPRSSGERTSTSGRAARTSSTSSALMTVLARPPTSAYGNGSTMPTGISWRSSGERSVSA
jgi:hypothetical protein